MHKVGILSDTHGWWDDKYAFHFDRCDEVWHAGDIGSPDVARRLAAICPLRAVYGNIDGGELRADWPPTTLFTVEQVRVLMTHIGGYPGRYAPAIRPTLYAERPHLFICGHSHILKVMYDRHLACLHINPGAAGKSGHHHVRTLVRLVIDGADIRDLEIIELES